MVENVPAVIVTKDTQVQRVAVPDSGYTFKGWISDKDGTFENSASLDTWFTMPASTVTVDAMFQLSWVNPFVDVTENA